LIDTSKPNVVNRVWSFFSSVRLTITLFIILAVTSVFGTVIPQQEAAISFVQKLSPGLVKLLHSLQLFDMYHSAWFLCIIGLLALNLIICSLNRWPLTLKRYRNRPSPSRALPFADIPPEEDILVEGDRHQARQSVLECLQARYKNTDSKETPEGDFFYGDKGRFSYFGVYLVHASFLLILLGASMGSLFGFEGYVNIPEKETIDSVLLKGGAHEHKNLGFQVRCDKFSVDYYDNGTPKEYRSDLSFLEQGQKVFQKPLLVNHPVSFRGVSFYQTSWGTLVGDRVKIQIKRSDKEAAPLIIDLEKEKPVDLPDNKGRLIVTHARSDHMRLGPAVHVVIQPKQGDMIRFWLFLNEKDIREKMPGIFNQFDTLNPAAFKPFIFSLVQIDSRYYTGLLVKRDPGVPLVWMGFILIMVGLFIAFFTSHQQVWIRVIQEKGKTRVRLAGRANKNAIGLERDIDRLRNEISTRIKQ
jgi:cytochrome c biogenesis protein